MGSPSGRMTAWMFAPKSRCLPLYQASIVSPLTLVVVSALILHGLDPVG
jgi:hypothetical protein